MSETIINRAVLEPLFGPADVPSHHRVRAAKRGDPAEVVKGRRPTRIAIAQNLRRDVAEWREAQYAGVSDTTLELLHHWFGRDHVVTTADGLQQPDASASRLISRGALARGLQNEPDASACRLIEIPFCYYFCQREAIETLIYLYELRGVQNAAKLEMPPECRECKAPAEPKAAHQCSRHTPCAVAFNEQCRETQTTRMSKSEFATMCETNSAASKMQ